MMNTIITPAEMSTRLRIDRSRVHRLAVRYNIGVRINDRMRVYSEEDVTKMQQHSTGTVGRPRTIYWPCPHNRLLENGTRAIEDRCPGILKGTYSKGEQARSNCPICGIDTGCMPADLDLPHMADHMAKMKSRYEAQVAE